MASNDISSDLIIVVRQTN